MIFMINVKKENSMPTFPFIYLHILDNQFYIFIFVFKPMHSM